MGHARFLMSNELLHQALRLPDDVEIVAAASTDDRWTEVTICSARFPATDGEPLRVEPTVTQHRIVSTAGAGTDLYVWDFHLARDGSTPAEATRDTPEAVDAP